MDDICGYLKEKYSFSEVIELQKRLTLEQKEKIAAEVIKTALETSKRMASVAFSGGKDSEVVADLIERYAPEAFGKVHCIFGNTGIEFPESMKFARYYGKKHFGERFHETKLSELEEDELRYDFARELIQRLEDENALDEILKADGKLKNQKVLVDAALKRGYTLNRENCFFKGHKKNFTYCIEQYGTPLLGKSASQLDAHRINIECFLKYSKTNSVDDKLKEYYEVLTECKFSQHCCYLLKKEPSDKLQKELGVDMVFMGIMASESRRRLATFATRGHLYRMKSVKDREIWHCHPLGLWTDDDIWAYIHKYKLEYSPLYDITYKDHNGCTQCIKRNGCIFCGTDIQFKDNHLAVLRQTHPKLYEYAMDKLGYREQLHKLFKIRKNANILTAYTDEGTTARLIERFGNSARIADLKPCAYDEFGELVDLTGTGIDSEYDAEYYELPTGQITMM